MSWVIYVIGGLITWEGFYFGHKIIEFSELDVCLSLGLPIVGEAIDLNKVGHQSVCRDYFPNGNVDLKMVYDFLLQEHDNFPLEHFCSLYLLVGISEFLFPSRSGLVFPIIFDLVSELGCLGNYKWGSVVYEYFIESLSSASTTMKNERSRSHFHVSGCAYLLQVYVMYLISNEFD